MALYLRDAGQSLRLVLVALPGDIVRGVEGVPLPHAQEFRALTPCSLQTLPAPRSAPARVALLARLLQQQARQALDMTELRTGSAPLRIKALLVLLAGRGGRNGHAAVAGTAQRPELPLLRDIAAIVGAAPETVSRVLSHLGRQDLLHDRRRAGGRYDAAALASAKWPAGMTRSGPAVARILRPRADVAQATTLASPPARRTLA
ncbi:MAG: Crp/Fnr family transcriptional regulator [Rubrivivax sp.]|nr:Crp/Fnr family transcriptional regulator [Rubrivivax sp.]